MRRPQCHRTSKRKKVSLPTLVRWGDDSDPDTSDTKSLSESESTDDNDVTPSATISRTDLKDWKKITEGKSGRKVRLIEYTPRPEDAAFRSDADPTGKIFDVKIKAEEVEAMKDKN